METTRLTFERTSALKRAGSQQEALRLKLGSGRRNREYSNIDRRTQVVKKHAEERKGA